MFFKIINQEYIKETNIVQVSVVYWTLQAEGPVKLLLYAHLLLLELISLTFFVGVFV